MNLSLKDWSGSGATEALHDTLKEFTINSDRQSQRLLQLTWAIVILTVFMSVAVSAQIWVALTAPPSLSVAELEKIKSLLQADGQI